MEVDTSRRAERGHINAYGVRAHDGDPGSGGTEIPIYAYPYIPFGVNGPDPMNNTFAFYPYVTGNCTVDFNEFDMDAQNTGDQGLLTANARGGGHVLNVGDAQMSGTVCGSATRQVSIDANPLQNTIRYLAWSVIESELTPATQIIDCSNNCPSTIPPSISTIPSYRLYFPADGGSEPVKPYLEQQLTSRAHRPPTEGQATTIQITVRIVNPTANSIAFGGVSNLVSATIPSQSGAIVVLKGGLDATPGTTIVTSPGVGNPGLITWNPGTVGSNETKILTYQILVTPNNGSADNQTISVTGQPGGSNGTQATFVDETGSATYTFGHVCGLSVTEGTSITHVSLSSFRAYPDGSHVRVQWETSGEAGTSRGFVLTRLNERSGGFEPVHNGRIRALMKGSQGGTYSIIDSGAVAGGKYAYQLIEIQSNGGRRTYGPFEVTIDGSPADLGFVRERDSTNDSSLHTDLFGSLLEEPIGSVREPRKTARRARPQLQQAREVSQSFPAPKQDSKAVWAAKLAVGIPGSLQTDCHPDRQCPGPVREISSHMDTERRSPDHKSWLTGPVSGG